MRRADRLFHLVQLIRGRRLSTADFLAGRLEVSRRTVYRDVADLQAQGVPIEGEAGIGYRFGAGFDLPPLMFSHDEARALAACVRMALPRLDEGLADAAEGALGKILAVLPPAQRAAVEALRLYAPAIDLPPAALAHLATLREASEARRKVQLHYRDLQEKTSRRVVRPLGCFYWGQIWTLAAWCETREDFRSFRLDRIEQLQVLDTRFRDEAGKTLADLRRLHGGAQGNARRPRDEPRP
jgi:predicted DNA-binding transcriptional regulator YafY